VYTYFISEWYYYTPKNAVLLKEDLDTKFCNESLGICIKAKAMYQSKIVREGEMVFKQK
jgi:hypothetical protein